jgi:hypothetical protein
MAWYLPTRRLPEARTSTFGSGRGAARARLVINLEAFYWPITTDLMGRNFSSTIAFDESSVRRLEINT